MVDVIGQTNPAGPPVGLSAKPTTSDLWTRQQDAVLAFGRRSNAQPALTILMQDAGALVGEMLHADLSGVAIVEPNGALVLSLTSASAASGSAARPRTCRYSLDAASSLAAYSLSTAAPVFSVNIVAESRFCDLFLRKQEVISALCVPLHLGNQGLGALGVYSRSVREFSVDDARFVETIAHLLAASIGRLRVEEELRQQLVLASTVLETIDSLALVLDPEGIVLDINPACQRASGRSLAEAHGKPFWDVFVTPQEAERVRRVLLNSPADTGPRHFESPLLAKDGRHRPMAWSLRTVTARAERGGRMLLIGADPSEQSRAETDPGRSGLAAQGNVGKAEETRPVAELGQLAALQSSASEAAAVADRIAHVGPEQPFALVGGKVGKDQRRSPRRSFHYRQFIAPVIGHRLPALEEFSEVQCRDISAGGIAFVLDRAPDFTELVVALGRPPQRTYFMARVVRVQLLSEQGSVSYLVGCQFTGRAAL